VRPVREQVVSGWVAYYGCPVRTPSAAALVVLLAAIVGCGEAEQDQIEVAPAPAPAPLTLAVIGDTPYGDEQEAAFPALVDAIDGDDDVDLVLHVGDIKTGGSTCSAERYRRLRRLFESFASPFVYTPGDNEWTDCHQPEAGGHDPADRLALVRRTFYPRPERSLGSKPIRVEPQPGFVENALWVRQRVVFATVHVTGSENGSRLPGGEELLERRLNGAILWINYAFRRATNEDARGIVLALHADMFANRRTAAFRPIIQSLQERAAAFVGPVLMLNGDSHVYRIDRPFEDAPNFTRIVVQGETADEWLRLDIDPETPDVFAWDRQRVRP
jgi:hypothetical protein